MSSELSGGLNKVSSPEDFPSGKTCLDERTGERVCVFEMRRRQGLPEEPVHVEYVDPKSGGNKTEGKTQAQLREEKALEELDAELAAEDNEPFIEEDEDDNDEEADGEGEDEEEGAETPRLPQRKGSEEGMAAQAAGEGEITAVPALDKMHPAKLKKWMKDNGFQLPESGKKKDLLAAIEAQSPQGDAADSL